MSNQGSSLKKRGRLSRIIDEIEETIIAIILAMMVIITFINVVLRYGFNSGLIWGLEMVTFLFAWLVLLGISYGVKKKLHLGVDALINIVSTPTKHTLALIVGVLCILIRVFNPAYPEGVMLAILLMNVFAPTIDHYVIEANVKRRENRLKTQLRTA